MNETVFFFERDGHRRRGEKANCEICNTEFIRRIKPYPGRPNKKYCTRSCAARANRKRVIFKCYICNTETERVKSAVKRSRHGVYFCGRECKDFAQSLEGNCKAIQPDHYGTGIHNYREKCKKQISYGCEGCGEKKVYKLLVHHKDKNKENNEMSNLEVVCWNCHTVRHLRKLNGKWMLSYKFLTPRNMIEELT